MAGDVGFLLSIQSWMKDFAGKITIRVSSMTSMFVSDL